MDVMDVAHLLHLPFSFAELAMLLAVLGAAWVSAAASPGAARRRALFAAGLVFLAALAAWADAYTAGWFAAERGVRLLRFLAGDGAFAIDEVNAPLLPLVALVYASIILGTLRTKVRRFSFARTLATEALALATLSAGASWVLVALLAACCFPAALELRVRRRSLRVYALHMGAFVLALASGWFLVTQSAAGTRAAAIGFALLAVAVAVRSGLVPVHCWVTDLFENGAFGTAILTVAPLDGAYAAARLIVPAAPEAVLHGVALAALATSLYAAAMSLVQLDVRRLFGFAFLSHAALVLAGLALGNALGMTGALCLWLSVVLAMSGLGLTLRSLEARTGRLSLATFHGLHTQTPTLAAFYLITGLAAVGFPGTVGFFGAEMLADGASTVAVPLGVAVILAAALNGIAVLRAYGRLFLGTRHPGTVDLTCRRSERFAVLSLAALLLGGSIWPQPGVDSRREAARRLLEAREQTERSDHDGGGR